jgi:hypothetical protein
MATAKKSTAKRRTTSSRKVISGGGGLKLNRRFNSPLALLLILLAAAAGGVYVWRTFAVTGMDYVYLQTYLTDAGFSKKLTRIAVDGSSSKVIYNQDSGTAPEVLRNGSIANISASPSNKYVQVETGNSHTSGYQNPNASVTIDTATGKIVKKVPKLTSYPGFRQFEWLAEEKGVFASIKYDHAVNTVTLDGQMNGSGYFLADTSRVTCVSSLAGTNKVAFTYTDPGVGSGGLDNLVAMAAYSADNFSARTVAEEGLDGKPSQMGCPFWAPGGKQIAYSIGNKDATPEPVNGQIFLSDPNYDQPQSLAPRTFVTDGNINPQLTGGRSGGVNVWSPDGKFLLFTKRTSNNVENLYKINVATKAITQITDNKGLKTRYTMYGYTKGGWIVFAYEDRVRDSGGNVKKSGPAAVKSISPNGAIRKTLYKEPLQAVDHSTLYLDQMDF